MSNRALLRWEFRDATRSAWFLVAGGLFMTGGLALLMFGTTSAVLGTRGFARSLAALTHLALLVVPLMALLASTTSIAGDRERGTLSFLLSQPVSRARVFGSRWSGLAGAMCLAVTAAFGAIGTIAASRGVSTLVVLELLGLTLLLAAAFVSIGLLISAPLRSRSRALATGLGVWLGLVALGSLGVMTAFVRWGAPPVLLESWALLNPVEAYRLAALEALGAGPELTGPVGVALDAALGPSGTLPAGAASLVIWTLTAFAAGMFQFRHTDA